MKTIRLLIIFTILFFNLNYSLSQIQTGVFRTPQGNTDYHHFVRDNSGAAVYINQVSTGPILRLSSGTETPNSNVKFTFEGNGYFGLGTDIVSEKLVLYKTDATQVATQYANLNTNIGSGNGFLVGIEPEGNGIVWNRENNFIRFGTNSVERMRIKADGNIDIYGILTSNAFKTSAGNTDYHHFTRDSSGGAVVYINQVSTGPILRLSSGIVNANQNVKFTVENNGAVGIATVNTGDYMLAVNGKIRAKEIKVETGWSDFVFDNNYHLRDIKEVESFIKINKHLPDVPAAKEVEKDGVNLGEMDARLLQKIEELTLYMIDQNKRIEQLEKENELLKEKIGIAE